ncbi:hypothetical protein [Polluticaenibacter yanchengensis]|uniref:Uncharacterized protein n=1 Tax=Polluticaenibacter yanchengensis TaxID=3014562 RepID=A0ABT4UQB8_9BACT|nr:hypothetical protein [Chitinophagaceae bacterium LY-5]
MKNIKLFPNIDEVFENITEYHKAVFFPLLTIDLSEINKGTGKVHFVSVFPSGQEEYDFPEENTGYNYIKFKRVNDKYEFDGNIKEIPLLDKAVGWYKEAEKIYQEHKEKYFTKDKFIKEEDDRRRKIDFNYSYYIEGVTNYWVTKDKFLETEKFIQGSAYTYGNDNQERRAYENMDTYDEYYWEYFQELLDELNIEKDIITFIGTVTGYNYSRLGEDEISLFINSETNEVLQYFNWS